MIRYLVLLLLVACQAGLVEDTTFTLDRAMPGYEYPSVNLEISDVETVYLNEYTDINQRENTLKLHHACYSDKLYAATILSPNIAVYDGSITYIDTNISPTNFRLKYVICGMNNTYVAESPYNADVDTVQ